MDGINPVQLSPLSSLPSEPKIQKVGPSSSVRSPASVVSFSHDARAHFQGVDEASGRFYFQVIDAKTEKVIAQWPHEEQLKLAAYLKEISQIVNEKPATHLVDDIL